MTEVEFIQKYTPTPEDELKNRIRMAFYTWVVTDPYPEVTDWQNYSRFEQWRLAHQKPDISVHQAWREGYEFAKKLAMNTIE